MRELKLVNQNEILRKKLKELESILKRLVSTLPIQQERPKLPKLD